MHVFDRKAIFLPRAELLADFWTITPEVLLSTLQTTPRGLSTIEARERLARYGRQLFFSSRPSWPLSIATLAIISITLILPYLPLLPNLLGLASLPKELLVWLGIVVTFYVAAAEMLNRWFYRAHIG